MVYFTFDKPIFLWLFLVLPLLYIAHYFFLARTQKKAMHFANFITIKRIAGEKFVNKNITILILRTIIISILILTVSGTNFWYEGEINDYDYVFAIDNSISMITKDIEPTRIDYAKESAITLLNEMNSDTSFGLITFSTNTYILSQLTKDKINLKLFINSINYTNNGGTDLGNSIITSVNILSNTKKEKAIILFTDGSKTVGSSIDGNILDAINYANKNRVVIHIVGIGTNSEPIGYLPEIYGIKSIIDKDTIENITLETGGKYIYPTNQNEIKEFAKTIFSESKRGYINFDFSKKGLFILFVLLFLEWILINSIFRRIV
jgi:Ca-activated chloride channel homolog